MEQFKSIEKLIQIDRKHLTLSALTGQVIDLEKLHAALAAETLNEEVPYVPKGQFNIAKRVKEMYNYECQVCGTTIETSAGRYAEAAHIKSLGKPYNGPDVESNILCLCSNHHVMFDNGEFTIRDDLSLNGINGKLVTTKIY